MAESQRSLKVGLLGGTFDPVHQGHLALARHVLDRCRLDRVLFIPALTPPHKRQPAASFDHRAAMLAAALCACTDREQLALSLIEGQLPRPSYTIHTIEALSRERAGDRFFLIVGADMLFDLPLWHRADELLGRISLIVVNRDNQAPREIHGAIEALGPTYRRETPEVWRNDLGLEVHYLADIDLPVSSSAIRAALARGQEPAMLPIEVLRYIRENQLYRGQERA